MITNIYVCKIKRQPTRGWFDIRATPVLDTYETNGDIGVVIRVTRRYLRGFLHNAFTYSLIIDIT